MKGKKTSDSKKAYDFKLTDKSGQIHQLSKMKADYKVIYFYPKDDTPGCTIEAKEFSDSLSKFKKLNTVVIGISGGTDKTKEKFCTKHKLAHILLSDTDFEVSKKYKSYGKKKFMGREYMGIFRYTFILDKSDKIIHQFEQVTPKGHADEVLSFIKEHAGK